MSLHAATSQKTVIVLDNLVYTLEASSILEFNFDED
jgi:hypothetical protein